MFSPQDTANLLVEALPYFQEFSGKTIGGMLRYADAASVNATGSTRFFWTR